MKKLPPLKALRTFDAAARHSSFTSAARELHVTHGAVSRQVHNLEEFLGRSLFERLPRGIKLTLEGREYAARIGPALADIEDATQILRAKEDEPNVLTLSAMPGISVGWLIPRLPGFEKLHPEYQIRINTTPRLVDFRRENIDLGIRYGRGDWPGLAITRLFDAEEFPVCAPDLMKGESGIKSPADLDRVRLLHFIGHDHWAAWLKFAGIEHVDPRRGWVFDDTNVLVQSAIKGQGIALTNPRAVEAAMHDGLLVRPFDIVLATDVACYAVCPQESAGDPKIKAVIAWLLEQAGDSH